MTKVGLLFLGAFLPLAVVIGAAEPKPAFTNLDVFELEYADDPRISPDGKRIVYVRRGMDIMTDSSFGRLWT